MLRNPDARFSGIGLGEIRIGFRSVRRKDKFVFVGGPAVDHDDSHVANGNSCRRE